MKDVMNQKTPLSTRLSPTTVAIVISAVGSALTTATALLAKDSPEWIVSMILLSAVTTLSVGLGVHTTKDSEEKFDDNE